MSKAFTSESDESEERTLPEDPTLPPGAKNYITPAGAERLRQELAKLRIRLAQSVTGLDVRRTRDLARATYLQRRLDTMVEISPKSDIEILFGARVSLEAADGTEQPFQIVGVDEIDIEHGAISWVSPLGSALLGKKRGESVQLPAGALKIKDIRYDG